MEDQDKMKALLGDPQKIKLGDKEFTVEVLTMKRQIEVFNIIAQNFEEDKVTMMEKMAAGALDAISSVLNIPKEEIECPAADIMVAMLKIWEMNNFDPLYQAVATLNKKVLRQ